MAGVLNGLKGPWAIGGDWGCTPEEFLQTGWLKLVRRVTLAPTVHTCGQRIIDFFVVSDGLRHAAQAVYTIGDGGFYPHCPVRLLLQGTARATVARQLKVPLGFEAVLLHGPSAKGCEQKIE